MTVEDVVAFIVAEPSSTGLFSDFDGTLSPIVDDPARAEPLEGAVEALHELAACLAVVGVVSGRTSDFLVARLGLRAGGPVVHAYGLHGLVHTTGGEPELVEAALGWQQPIEQARDEFLASLPNEVDLEDKLFGFTLHWRRATDPLSAEGSARQVAERVAERYGLIVRPGRASLELVPPVGIDKGSVLVSWAERLEKKLEPSGSLPRLVILGDDVGDLLGFEAAGRLAAQGRAFVMRVAVASKEAPEALTANADVSLASPSEARDVLVEAARRLSRR